MVVDGLMGSLGRFPDLDVLGASTTLAAARIALVELRPDIVLLDLRLPDGSGTELLDEAQQRDDGTAFIVLSSFITPQYVQAAIALGASGYLLKTSPAAEIAAAIRRVADGSLSFTADQLHASRRAGWVPLSARQKQIIAGLMAGQSNDELSVGMGLSKKTIEAYLSRLFERFAVQTRTELAVLAEREQWLSLPSADRRNEGVRR
jgi:DNA-binding NarL/FixJ family response regulator